MKNVSIILISLLLLSNTLFAAKIFSTKESRYIDLATLSAQVSDYDLILLGETHAHESFHRAQLEIMKGVAGTVSVGLEFIDWTKKAEFDSYLAGDISEGKFLELVKWGTFPFVNYRYLIDEAVSSQGSTFGINAPSWLTRKISRNGLDALSNEDMSYLPPEFTLGSDLYFERFSDQMSGGHQMPPHALKRYFAAQSLWDDTMAYQSVQVSSGLDHPMFIVVGKFHVEYGLGLPSRIIARSSEVSIVTIVHVDANDLSDAEIRSYASGEGSYGFIGDYILFTKD